MGHEGVLSRSIQMFFQMTESRFSVFLRKHKSMVAHVFFPELGVPGKRIPVLAIILFSDIEQKFLVKAIRICF